MKTTLPCVLATFLVACALASPADAPTTAHRVALEWLSQHGSTIGLNDSAAQLRVIGERSAGGGTVVRFEQLHRGVPILGTLLVCEVRGTAVRIRTNELRVLTLDVTPTMDASVARSRARAAAGGKGHTLEELVIVPAGLIDGVKADTLAWRVEIESGEETWRVLVDAISGSVLHSERLLPRQ